MIAGRIENDIGINRNREEEISKRKFKTNRPKVSVGTGRTGSDRYGKSESDRVGEKRGMTRREAAVTRAHCTIGVKVKCIRCKYCN